MAVDVELNELDRSVGRKLSDHGESGDENSRADEQPVVGPSGGQLGQLVPVSGEVLDYPKELEDLEVVRRRLAVRAALRTELVVEILEERGGGSDDATAVTGTGSVRRRLPGAPENERARAPRTPQGRR